MLLVDENPRTNSLAGVIEVLYPEKASYPQALAQASGWP